MIKQLIRLDLFAFDSFLTTFSLNLSKGLIYSMNIGLTLFLINRFIISGHFPLSNLYESLMFLSWSFTLLFIVTGFFLDSQPFVPLVLPITTLTCAYAIFCIPPELQKANSLVPALESNWLIMHVSVMILSYASLLIGSLFALSLIWANNKIFLDNLSYRFIGLGFALLTLGIISGAVWANSAWGSYWSWDPKETWAFITWLTYAVYLHLRITRGWYGKQAAVVAILGFFVVWFCYLGVNLFGKGLHSYAFV